MDLTHVVVLKSSLTIQKVKEVRYMLQVCCLKLHLSLYCIYYLCGVKINLFCKIYEYFSL